MRNRIRIILVCILFLGTSAVPISVRSDIAMINGNNSGATDTITLYPSEDTRVNQHNPSVNYGLNSLVISNMYGATSNYEQDILIKFDLSSIPSSASIISASLHLYYYDYWDTDPVGRPINCYRITSSWNEMSVTWNTRPSYYNSVTSTTYVPSTWGWMSWNVKNDVISFISGSTTNYGWQLMDETYWGGGNIPQQLYKSREESPKPYLEIEIEIEGNNPPNKPSKPSGPASGYTGTSLIFSTTATDPDNDQIQYGWDWNGDSSVDEWSGLIASGTLHYKIHQWDNPGTYNIKVKAKDSNGAVSIWSDDKTLDILVEDQPPNTPSNPDPSNHALDIDINTDLSWTGGDPDIDDTVTYDVYFGSILPLPKIASNITTTVFDPGILINSLTYFWSIVAWDNHGASTFGPGWDFTTIKANNPPNKPSKPIGEINGSKGIIYLYTTNTTDPDGDQVYYLWDWGDDTFSEWIGPYGSGAIVDASHAWAIKGTYSIRVKALDINGAESDWSEPLSITMPKTYTHNPIIELLLKMWERFSFFEKILNQNCI